MIGKTGFLTIVTLLGTSATAQAQSAIDLIGVDPANRAGQPEVSRAIARIIAERSTSPAVRQRADRKLQWGRLAPTVVELLADLGADAELRAALANPQTVASATRGAALPLTPPTAVAPPGSPDRIRPDRDDDPGPSSDGAGSGSSGGSSGGGGGGGWGN
jgi:hypothetical protein